MKCSTRPGIVLHVLVSRTPGIVKATDGKAYVRRGAQNLPQDTAEQLRRLGFAKGEISFEGHPVSAAKELIIDSPVTRDYLKVVIPNYQAQPEAWLRKQLLIVNDMPTVAGLLLFAEEPQAQIPKRCGIKIYRYKTAELHGFRDVLEFIPITVEGCLYEQIKKAVSVTIQEVEKIPKMGEQGLEKITYPHEAIHEIITNAVNGQYTHTVIYIGQTGDLSTRFDDHHKADCFTSHKANCICTHCDDDEDSRLAKEQDLIAYYNPPCNG